MDRREFIAIAVTAAGLGICGGCIFARPSKVWGEGCLTSSDILGPFYRAGAPLRNDLRIPGAQGELLSVQGKVLGSDCSTAIADAKIEIWHCDASGAYDNKSAAFNYRAELHANSSGAYSINTIKPGRYLNGDSYRPAHIHFKVSAPGHTDLVTQLYFLGDPYLESDPFSSLPKARQRILEVKKMADQSLKVDFDIWLQNA